MSIKDEHWIERQGKRMVLFAGLLDEAHQRGLRSIDTELVQAPGQDNGNTAIVKATVTMSAAGTGEYEPRFSGIGDANPENVGRNIKPHLIRMAETRAKARALRDAVNVHALAFEELGGDAIESESEAVEAVREDKPERTPGGATVRAANYLISLREKKGLSAYGAYDLSARQVKEEIESLRGDG